MLTLVACAQHAALPTDQLDPRPGKADAASEPAGSYTNQTPHFGELSTLQLNDDYSFTRTRLVACPGGGSCAPATDTGTYLLTHGDGHHYVRFYDGDGTQLDRFEWTLDAGGTLELRRDDSTDWFAMSHGNACQNAGGNCVPLVPDACAIGTVGDANQYSCGGGLGVECCLPPQPSNACNTDSDCTGLLPHFCRTCASGGEDCAHWACVANSCQITTCN